MVFILFLVRELLNNWLGMQGLFLLNGILKGFHKKNIFSCNDAIRIHFKEYNASLKILVQLIKLFVILLV